MPDYTIKDEYMSLLNSWDSLGLWLFLRTVSDEEQTDLYNDFPKGLKVRYKRLHTALDKCGFMLAVSIAEDIAFMAFCNDDQGLSENLEIDGILFILNLCPDETINYIMGNLWTTEF